MMRQQKQRLAAIKGSTPGELTVHFSELGWLWLDKMTFILALDTNSHSEVPAQTRRVGLFLKWRLHIQMTFLSYL